MEGGGQRIQGWVTVSWGQAQDTWAHEVGGREGGLQGETGGVLATMLIQAPDFLSQVRTL